MKDTQQGQPLRGIGIAMALGALLCCSTARSDSLRARWAAIQQQDRPPCSSSESCHDLLRSLRQARAQACGDAPKCQATADLEREIPAAVKRYWRARCDASDARSCLVGGKFGVDDGYLAACDLGMAEGCTRACAAATSTASSAQQVSCASISNDRKALVARCAFKLTDKAEACATLGTLLLRASESNPGAPPRVGGSGSLYQTPLLADRPRARYALDYFSRACHLGHGPSCIQVCEPRPDDEAGAPVEQCRALVAGGATAPQLDAGCHANNADSCYQLAVLRSRMGFYEKDPAGFFISGVGRVLGLKAKACRLGYAGACEHRQD